jgi:dipeptidyl-peptidase III
MDRWLREQTELKHIIGPINKRVIKHEDGLFELLVHSTARRHHENKFYLKEYEFEGRKIKIADGDLEFILKDIIKNLKYVKFYASNDQEKKILDFYIEHFKSGREYYFRDALVALVKNRTPSIEFVIRFQETYLDPLGIRDEFEGLLAIVDKESQLYTLW